MFVSTVGIGGLFAAVFLINAVLALIPATIAQGKGRSFFGFWVFGLFFFLISLVVALVVPDQSKSEWTEVGTGTPSTRVPCPRCAELIAPGALVCRFCGNEFERPMMPPAATQS